MAKKKVKKTKKKFTMADIDTSELAPPSASTPDSNFDLITQINTEVLEKFDEAKRRFYSNQKAIYELEQRIDRIVAAICQSKNIRGM